MPQRVPKTTSHCAGTVQMREESESGLRKWEEMWFKTTAEDGERGGGAAVTCDGRLFHMQTSGCNRKRSVADSGQTSRLRCQRNAVFSKSQEWLILWCPYQPTYRATVHSGFLPFYPFRAPEIPKIVHNMSRFLDCNPTMTTTPAAKTKPTSKDKTTPTSNKFLHANFVRV